MQFIKSDINIDFIGKRKLAAILSAALILIGLGSLVVQGGPNYGIDFAGGSLVQVQFSETTDAAEIRQALSGVELGTFMVQRFGDNPNEYMIRVQESTSQALSRSISSALNESYGAGNVDLRRMEMVGPQVGKDLRQKGLLAILYAMVGILAYITWRFEFRFAVGAIVALVHDVLITLGVFSLFGMEVDLPIVAAFLAIIG